MKELDELREKIYLKEIAQSKEIMTLKELADFLRVSVQTARKLVMKYLENAIYKCDSKENDTKGGADEDNV